MTQSVSDYRLNRLYQSPLRIILVVLAIGALITAVASHQESIERQRAIDALALRLTSQVELRGATLTRTVAQLRRDITFLSNVPAVAGIVRASLNDGYDAEEQTADARWKKRLQAIFAAFARTQPDVLQIRLIGVANGGLELVRINRERDGISIVAADSLQTKADRDYFIETVKLKPGETYVSDLNLNREQGAIQVPHLPTLRAATPVFTANGELFGLLVVNIDARSILASLQESVPADLRVYLTNGAGDFLLHPDPRQDVRLRPRQSATLAGRVRAAAQPERCTRRADEIRPCR